MGSGDRHLAARTDGLRAAGFVSVDGTPAHPRDTPTPAHSTRPARSAARKRLAAELRARHVTDTHSGHGIAVAQPRTASDAVREVVDRLRNGPPEQGR
ncbi:hypothetical protein [Streptomyces yangpuensis]|uniref:hypothetical protein n=1 Tax=Streptomyces yangpuensis TaxID=1648182 RepID=UPI0037134054